MIDDVEERLKTDAALANVAVEQTDADDDVGQLAKLSDLLRSGQTDEGPEASTRQHRLEGGCDFALNRVRDGRSELDRRVVADDVLLVLVEQVVEDLLVQDSDAFEVIARARLEADDLIDQPVTLVAQVCDVLLPLHFLLDISRIVADLQLNGI